MTSPSPVFSFCYHDGAIRPTSEAQLSVLSLTARYALSVFEGVRLYKQTDGGKVTPFAMAAHLHRLRRSVRTLRLPEDGLDGLATAADELLSFNKVRDDAYLRIAVNASNSGDLAAPATTMVTMTVTAMGRKPWLQMGRRMRVTVSDVQRAPREVLPHHVKAICNYTGARVALMDAKERGFDSCVLKNALGDLCEAPTAILFVVKDGVIRTPSLESGCLPSITRATVIEICKQQTIPLSECTLTASDLYNADEAFFAGTAIELAPIGEVDGNVLPAENPYTRKLTADYFALARGLVATRAEFGMDYAGVAAVS